MGWEWANPFMLYGMGLATIPLLLHLFQSRKARPHAFAAIDFILRSQRRNSRKLRLKRIILFLLRTLLLLAIPLALARPQRKKALDTVVAQGPMAVMMALDTSMSMGYRLDGRALLERAKEMLRQEVNSAPANAQIGFLTCDSGDFRVAVPPSYDRDGLLRVIEQVQGTWESQEMAICLQRAGQILAASSLPRKRMVLATDMTTYSLGADWSSLKVETRSGDIRPEIIILDAAKNVSELPNVAITQLKVEAVPAVGHRAYQFTATVVNYSKKKVKDLKIALRVGQKIVAKSFVAIPAQGVVAQPLVYRFPQGGIYAGAMEIESDCLAADDVRYFAWHVPKDIHALIVNGAPHVSRYKDEAFFVEAALNAPGSPVRPVLRDSESLTNEKLSAYDLFFLLNLRTLPQEKIAELEKRVREGSGLMISLGDQVDVDYYNKYLGNLLPRKLHVLKTAAEENKNTFTKKPAHFFQIKFEHPALAVFSGDAKESILSVRTNRYFLLAPGDANQITPLVTYDDGAMALVESKYGLGKVLLYTSTVDRAWTDWPIRTSFLPVMQRLAGWLSGALDEKNLEQVMVGETKKLSFTPTVDRLIVAGSNKKEIPVRKVGDHLEAVVRFPGIYQVQTPVSSNQEALSDSTFAANIHSGESNLARLDEKEWKLLLGGNTQAQTESERNREILPWPVWSVLLALAAVVLMAEGALQLPSRIFRKKQK